MAHLEIFYVEVKKETNIIMGKYQPIPRICFLPPLFNLCIILPSIEVYPYNELSKNPSNMSLS